MSAVYGVDFFEILYYKAGADCGYNPDPNLRYCLDAPLALMLNTSSIWSGDGGGTFTKPGDEKNGSASIHLKFCITYSNDVDANKRGEFVGEEGMEKFANLTNTWVSAMGHPHYLKVGGRPVFKILIPQIFLDVECGSNATLANFLLEYLRSASVAAGLQPPLIGGGWQNPSIPAVPQPTPRPHPDGYMLYNTTRVDCEDCVIETTANHPTIAACQYTCNTTVGCLAFEAEVQSDNSGRFNCTFKNEDAPGAPDATAATYVRVPGQVHYDYTGSYNAAPPICPIPSTQGGGYEVCPMYKDSWLANATADGAKVFPYDQCGDFQIAARTNHSHDPVPYVPNVIAGFDPRPWEEHSPSFQMPNRTEWMKQLYAIKAQCEDPSNRFGFPSTREKVMVSGRDGDSSTSKGCERLMGEAFIQPAFTIYAWNEYAEGGILAPSRGQRYMKLEALAEVFGGRNRTQLR